MVKLYQFYHVLSIQTFIRKILLILDLNIIQGNKHPHINQHYFFLISYLKILSILSTRAVAKQKQGGAEPTWNLS